MVSVLDASDEQFEAFRLAARIPVDEKEEGAKWSFENRCRAINHALKYRLKLPFVEQNPSPNNSEKELFQAPERTLEADESEV